MPSMGRSSSAASLLADGGSKEHIHLLGAPPLRPVTALSPPRFAPSPPHEARAASFPYPGAPLHGAASTPALVPAAALHGAASTPALVPATDGRAPAGRAYVFSGSPPSAGRSRTTYASQTHYAGGGGSSPFHRSMVASASARLPSSTQPNGSHRSTALVSPPMIGNTEDVIAASSAAADIASAAAAAAEAAAAAASAAVADVEAMLREGRKSIEVETQLRMEVLLQQARTAVEACTAPSPPPPPPPPQPQPQPQQQQHTVEEDAPITAPNLEALSRAKSQARARAEALQRETALVEERARLLALQMRSSSSAALDQVRATDDP